MMMRPARRIAAVALAFLLSFAAVPVARAGDGTKSYASEKHDIRFDYPQKYERDKEGDGISLKYGDSERHVRQIQFFIEKTDEKKLSENDLELVAKLMESAMKDAGARIVKRGDAELGGRPARRFTYTLTQDGVEVKGQQVFAVRKSKIYVLHFVGTEKSFEDHYDDFQVVTKSFRWSSGK
jgi:hypothetical protein